MATNVVELSEASLLARMRECIQRGDELGQRAEKVRLESIDIYNEARKYWDEAKQIYASLWPDGDRHRNG